MVSRDFHCSGGIAGRFCDPVHFPLACFFFTGRFSRLCFVFRYARTVGYAGPADPAGVHRFDSRGGCGVGSRLCSWPVVGHNDLLSGYCHRLNADLYPYPSLRHSAGGGVYLQGENQRTAIFEYGAKARYFDFSAVFHSRYTQRPADLLCGTNRYPAENLSFALYGCPAPLGDYLHIWRPFVG